jgi:hypothetical protein
MTVSVCGSPPGGTCHDCNLTSEVADGCSASGGCQCGGAAECTGANCCFAAGCHGFATSPQKSGSDVGACDAANLPSYYGQWLGGNATFTLLDTCGTSGIFFAAAPGLANGTHEYKYICPNGTTYFLDPLNASCTASCDTSCGDNGVGCNSTVTIP